MVGQCSYYDVSGFCNGQITLSKLIICIFTLLLSTFQRGFKYTVHEFLFAACAFSLKFRKSDDQPYVF